LRRVIPIVLAHHDKFNGSGYHPTEGESIPLEARIIAVADVYDALTSNRPYRAAMPHAAVIARLGEASGRTLDEDAVVAFVDLIQTLSTARPDVGARPV
jgi:two-component system response regulator RpfG